MPCACCTCPDGRCDCSKSTNIISVSLLAHIPCLIAIGLSALGIGTAFAANIHKFVPLLFLVSIGCIIWSFSRWKKTNKTSRIIVVAISVLVLVLWYPHRHHIFPWIGRDKTMEHMDPNMHM